MPISLGGFLVGRLLADREGVTDTSQANQLGVFGALLGTSTLGIIATAELVRRQVDTTPPPVTPPGTGGPLVQVPDVSKENADDAQALLVSLGLKVQTVQVRSTTVQQGFVIDQNPAAGTEVPPNSTVRLSVSLGDQLVEIADVRGVSSDEARQILTGQGFSNISVAQLQTDIPDLPDNQVFAQHPDPNLRVAPSAQVILFVNAPSVGTGEPG